MTFDVRSVHAMVLVQVKVDSRTGQEGPEVVAVEVYSRTFSLNSTVDGDGWSTPRSSRFTPGKDPVPVVQEAGWTPGPVWRSAENLACTGIRSPDCPARSDSLCLRPSNLFLALLLQNQHFS